MTTNERKELKKIMQKVKEEKLKKMISLLVMSNSLDIRNKRKFAN